MTTVGYGDISASTTVERGFSLFAMLIGCFVFAHILGNFSALANKATTTEALFDSKMESVHEYMRFRKLPRKLRLKIRQFYEYLYSRRTVYDESAILNELTPGLRSKVLSHLYEASVRQFPPIKNGSDGFVSAIIDCLTPIHASPGDFIYREGQVGERMFVVLDGFVQIAKGGNVLNHLVCGDYFGELAICSKIRYQEQARAVTFSEIVALRKVDVDELAESYDDDSAAIEQFRKERMAAFLKGGGKQGDMLSTRSRQNKEERSPFLKRIAEADEEGSDEAEVDSRGDSFASNVVKHSMKKKQTQAVSAEAISDAISDVVEATSHTLSLPELEEEDAEALSVVIGEAVAAALKTALTKKKEKGKSKAAELSQHEHSRDGQLPPIKGVQEAFK
eukprot:CAMPEP_0113914366 /NCGR_PEP_ID=MMETSP0780_2-20120614/30322_1 /TAXON_ID=652834 /ORGANISM="Palpitomonas bilix" /LENGTH=391 /DNA_ID=CAMNT_0000912187 /DNA_START=643 /DNA_END=1818 /DNA_ORIENTATION=+ /assembly_acc=CAM_ASM_000599